MAPAIRPAVSWSPPSVADTSCTSPASNVSGSAPYLRTLARLVASDWVKLPVICAWPPTIGPLFSPGAETTSPSRTMPNRFCGSVSWDSRRVVSANFFLPSPVKLRSTCQPPVEMPWLLVSRPADADFTSVPSTSAGPRMYFSLPSSRQVTSGLLGLSSFCARMVCRTCAGSEQSSAANSCCSCAVAVASAPPVADGVGVGVADGVADGLLLPALRSAFGITALLVLADGDGLAVPEGVTDGEAPPVALGEADGDGTVVGAPAPASS